MTKRIVLLQALASTPGDIRRLVRSLDGTAAADWRPSADAWSATDVASHLLAVEEAYLQRVERVLHEHEPLVPYIHAGAPRAADVTAAQLVEQFHTAREAMLETLRRLTPGEWQRVAIHETKGRTTLRFLVQDLIEHDIEHTNQLVEIGRLWRASHPRPNATVAS